MHTDTPPIPPSSSSLIEVQEEFIKREMAATTPQPVKIEVRGKLYCNHPTLGWLLNGSWGWQPCNDPTV